MLTQQAIHDFFEQSDYDIRKSGNGRWIDQKCTADVVTIISDFIYDYVANHPGCSFSSSDIWYSEYASQTVEAVFKKLASIIVTQNMNTTNFSSSLWKCLPMQKFF